MKNIVSSHNQWKYDYSRFKADYSNLSFDVRFNILFSGSKKVLSQIEQLKNLADIATRDELVDDAHRLLSDLEENNITRASALPILRSGIENLSDKMNFVIYQAQVKTQCELNPRPIGIDPKASVGTVQ